MINEDVVIVENPGVFHDTRKPNTAIGTELSRSLNLKTPQDVV